MVVVWYVLAAIAVAWVGMLLTAGGVGGLVFIIVAALLAGLKLAGVVEWSWWWTLLPLWGAASGAFAKMWIVTRDPFWKFRK
jgi:hypothetical protein